MVASSRPASCKGPESADSRLCALVDPITTEILDDISDADDAFPEFVHIVKIVGHSIACPT